VHGRDGLIRQESGRIRQSPIGSIPGQGQDVLGPCLTKRPNNVVGVLLHSFSSAGKSFLLRCRLCFSYTPSTTISLTPREHSNPVPPAIHSCFSLLITQLETVLWLEFRQSTFCVYPTKITGHSPADDKIYCSPKQKLPTLFALHTLTI
jgi:hypothetical protein